MNYLEKLKQICKNNTCKTCPFYVSIFEDMAPICTVQSRPNAWDTEYIIGVLKDECKKTNT